MGNTQAWVSLAGNDCSHIQLYVFISISYRFMGTGDEKSLLC